MGNLVLQLNNSQNWDFVYQNSYQSISTSNKPQPISEITIPFLIDKPIIAVYTSSLTAKSTWRFAGFLNQKIQLGLLVGGVPDARISEKRKLSLNSINLLIYPQLYSNYSLSIEPPFWLRDISVSVYKYVGILSDSTEVLINQIKNTELLRIESKVDAL